MSGPSDAGVNAEIEAVSNLGEHLINSIIADEPTDVISRIIEHGAPLWYQNDAEGMSALHAAAYRQNAELVKLLIEKGAVWNAVDNLKNTAGDISLSFNDGESYTIIRDAGIRAELLLSLLSSKASIESSSSLILRESDDTAAGSTDAFLSSKLRFSKDAQNQDVCLVKVGEEEIGVMMGWERGIMEETVRMLCDDRPGTQELKVLNIGFGLGIIDGLFQSLPVRPCQHVIIEPHPDVLQHMKDHGWYERPGVKILEGKWQDFISSDEILAIGGFDVVYTDTFSEDYGDLHTFFEHLPDLLAGPESRFSFFNGLGATNALFYDVYTHIAELHLAEIGGQFHDLKKIQIWNPGCSFQSLSWRSPPTDRLDRHPNANNMLIVSIGSQSSMFSPAYYRPRRETSEVIVYLSPNQLAPTTVPSELQSYMSQDSWSQRIPAIIKTSSRFAKPRQEAGRSEASDTVLILESFP
ncbi:Protein arginine N-methyltransferase 2 [Hypsizygus marmoreus]|uniref:Protein arginine N-methyltransferase 2 n=1 Tax=Hypsizygus marmoreus TaxID=39966 RepID=A0A369JYA4_HYPMA|nr:Protein arginine N-methyltransferase 2 [Hypsizygus marmoreus]